jgi:hypothetical protein
LTPGFSEIMTNNEAIVNFNSAEIAKNAALIASGCGFEQAPLSNFRQRSLLFP